jgi:antitoxin component of MazEF toxin-antitoxin module
MTTPFEIRKIQAVGSNSLYTTLPNSMVKLLGIRKGAFVKITLDKDRDRIVVEAFNP